MIKSTLTKDDYLEIYESLNRVSPLDTDCGELCSACCCTAEEAEREMGIYLLPGEDKVHDRHDGWLSWTAEDAEDYDFPESWQGKVYFVRCKGPGYCRREIRPIQCRSFPLLPHLTEDDELMMVYNDLELPYRCPLIDEEIPLNDDFVEATRKAWEKLITDPLIRDLVMADSEEREQAVTELEEMLGV